ncbi:hypothetical protein ACOSP7_003843 [Xanthoceras sorbifolium]
MMRVDESSRNKKQFVKEISKGLVSKLRKSSTETTPKTPLTIVPSPFQLSLSLRPNKRAVLCGVNYVMSKNSLKGTINDAKNMRNMLITKFGFQEKGIIMLTEEEAEEHLPTKRNILKAMKWLVEGCKNGDSLVFYFAGHGSREPVANGDDHEIDGFDETLCPLDFMEEGMILDDDINSIIVRPLVKGVILHAIVDACYSGTILDLNYEYNRDAKKWVDSIPPRLRAKKATSGGLAICISACQEDQVATDTAEFSGNTFNGAMTYVLTESVRKHPGITYGDILDLIRDAFEEVGQRHEGRRVNWFLWRSTNYYESITSQKPQLSSSKEFDVYKTHFKL